MWGRGRFQVQIRLMEGPTRLPKSPASSGETLKAREEECDMVWVSVRGRGRGRSRGRGRDRARARARVRDRDRVRFGGV